jgi:hypothetical protein
MPFLSVRIGWAYVLRIFFASVLVFDHPPQMAGQVHGSALVRLLEQFAAV